MPCGWELGSGHSYNTIQTHRLSYRGSINSQLSMKYVDHRDQNSVLAPTIGKAVTRAIAIYGQTIVAAQNSHHSTTRHARGPTAQKQVVMAGSISVKMLITATVSPASLIMELRES